MVKAEAAHRKREHMPVLTGVGNDKKTVYGRVWTASHGCMCFNFGWKTYRK